MARMERTSEDDKQKNLVAPDEKETINGNTLPLDA